MITQFQLLDDVGEVIGEGEIENDMYRLFSAEFPNGYKEFKTLEAMFAACGGVAIQPWMFQTPARTRQLGLLDDDVEYRAATDARMPSRE